MRRGTELFSRAVDTRADLAIDAIIDSARRSCGMSSARGWFRRRLANLTSKAVRLGKTYKYITGGLAILTGIVPFIFGQLIAGTSGESKVLAIFLAVVIISVLVIASFLLPKTLADNVAEADNLRFELVVNRLAGQVALQNMIQRIPADQDRQSIDWLTNRIDPVVQRTFKGREQEFYGIIQYCPHWKDSMFSLGNLGISVGLEQRFSAITESIAQVARIIFNTTQCTVKIYLQTEHRLGYGASGKPVQLLTAVGRFPPGERGFWKSWIQCSGREADVWQAFRRKEVLVYQHVKSVTENKVYPTIACMPLPDDIGIVTIEANDPNTFTPLISEREAAGKASEAEFRTPVPDHIIDQDLHQSLTVSVKELVLKAIRAEIQSIIVSRDAL